ncbi:hypothetical protein LINPERHAP1_LOCUS1469 [Linum perenne]
MGQCPPGLRQLAVWSGTNWEDVVLLSALMWGTAPSPAPNFAILPRV